MLRQILSTLALCFSPLLYVTVIEPIDFSAPTVFSEYFEAGAAGYSYRWSSDDNTAYLECKVYDLCLWVDVKGPTCSDELHLNVSYYDRNDVWMTENRVVIAGDGKDRFDAVEIGSYLDFDFNFYLVDAVWCSVGVPTTLAEA
jgi:hypothetical protein